MTCMRLHGQQCDRPIIVRRSCKPHLHYTPHFLPARSEPEEKKAFGMMAPERRYFHLYDLQRLGYGEDAIAAMAEIWFRRTGFLLLVPCGKKECSVTCNRGHLRLGCPVLSSILRCTKEEQNKARLLSSLASTYPLYCVA